MQQLRNNSEDNEFTEPQLPPSATVKKLNEK
jgi:hypothetical protein